MPVNGKTIPVPKFFGSNQTIRKISSSVFKKTSDRLLIRSPVFTQNCGEQDAAHPGIKLTHNR